MPDCVKISYESRSAAYAAIASIKSKRGTRPGDRTRKPDVYRCSFYGQYHWGHNDQWSPRRGTMRTERM